jgi:hypothetical protein
MDSAGQQWEIVMGYDRPLHMLFLEVYRVENEETGLSPESCAYDSLHHPELDWTLLATVCHELQRIGLHPPAEMLLALWSDQRCQSGNLVVRHRSGQVPEVLQNA